MNDEQVWGWITAMLLVGLLASGVRYSVTLNQVMAEKGFQAYRLPGSTDVYWYKPQTVPGLTSSGPTTY